MKKCSFPVEALSGMPLRYENWFEHLTVELTDEQYNRYCDTLRRWMDTDEWKKWDVLNGEDYFIKRDLPDIFAVIWNRLEQEAPKIWDERIMEYLDQINIFTAEEIYYEVWGDEPV